MAGDEKWARWGEKKKRQTELPVGSVAARVSSLQSLFAA